MANQLSADEQLIISALYALCIYSFDYLKTIL